MGASRGTRLAVAALAGAAGVLTLINVHLLQSPVDISPLAPPTDKGDARRPERPEPATALDKKAPEQFQETVGRPLFNPGRRPVRHEAAAGQPTKTELGKLRLIGVMKLGEERPRALIRFADEPTGKWIAEGDEFNGWKLRKVNERSVIVEAGKRSQELTLPTPRAAPAGPPPGEAASPAGTDRN